MLGFTPLADQPLSAEGEEGNPMVDIVGPPVEIYSVHIESTDAAMVHDVPFAMSVYSYDTVPDGTATLTNGTVVLNPTVSGSNPYTLTFPISRLDLQEGSYPWTLSIGGETETTASIPYTIDGNGTTEFYGTVTDQAAWIAEGYTEVVDGDNIYAIRTSGTTTPVLASCSFTGPSTWDIYIQDVADDVWGSSGTLTVPAGPSFLPIFAPVNNQLARFIYRHPRTFKQNTAVTGFTVGL